MSEMCQSTKSLRDSPLRGEPNCECGNRRQDRQSTKSLHAISSSVEAVRLVCEHGGRGQNGPQIRARDAEGYICIVK